MKADTSNYSLGRFSFSFSSESGMPPITISSSNSFVTCLWNLTLSSSLSTIESVSMLFVCSSLAISIHGKSYMLVLFCLFSSSSSAESTLRNVTDFFSNYWGECSICWTLICLGETSSITSVMHPIGCSRWFFFFSEVLTVGIFSPIDYAIYLN